MWLSMNVAHGQPASIKLCCDTTTSLYHKVLGTAIFVGGAKYFVIQTSRRVTTEFDRRRLTMGHIHREPHWSRDALDRGADSMAERDTDVSIDDDDGLLSAGESLALIERQQQEAQRRLGFNPALILGLWGAAYLFGFGAIFLTYPTAVPLRLPGAVAGVPVSYTHLTLPT